MAQHTPGPWEVRRLDSYGDTPLVYEAQGRGQFHPRLIAVVQDGDGQPAGEYARLIAAAPDMLSALREALEELGTIDGNIADSRETYVSTTVIKTIEAAIAKALGE